MQKRKEKFNDYLESDKYNIRPLDVEYTSETSDQEDMIIINNSRELFEDKLCNRTLQFKRNIDKDYMFYNITYDDIYNLLSMFYKK